VYERVVEGELEEGDYPILVEEIRIMLKEVGQVAQLGHSFTWTLNKGSSGTRNVEVAVTVRAGKTRILVQEHMNNLAGAVFGGVGGGIGGGGMGPIMGILFGGLGLPGQIAIVFVPAWLTLTYGIARSSYYYAVKRRDKKLKALADRLEQLTRELIGPHKLLGR
jgi:hypothetical protein